MTDLPPHPEDGDEDRYVHGTYAIQHVIGIDNVGKLYKTMTEAAFIIDTQTQQLVQFGAEGEVDVSQVEVIAEMLQMDPATFWPHLGEEGSE